MRRRAVLAALLLIGAAAILGWRLARADRYRPPRGLRFPAILSQATPYRSVEAFPGLRFDDPVFLTGAPGTGRLFVVEQAGIIRSFENRPDATRTEVFLDLRAQVSRGGREEGLLGLAFAPDFASSRRFYVYYSAAGPRRSVLSRFTPAGEEVLLEVEQPYDNHNGGMLAFGPDGMLYLGLGDGGSGGDPKNHGQNRATLLGSIVRLDVSGPTGYVVPPDNPFVGEPGSRGEIWAYGLRNPWRFSFDAAGRLWAGDVGQNAWEEIDLVQRGGNYGWRVFEGHGRLRHWRVWGAEPDGPVEPPLWQYAHEPAGSVTGGYVYRGARLPGLQGRYVFGDYVTGDVWALSESGGRVTDHERIARVPALSSFGEDNAGELYALSLRGRVYRFEPAPAAREPGLPVPRRLSETGLFADLERLEPTPGLLEYEVVAPAWLDGARARRWFAVPRRGSIGIGPGGAWTFPHGSILVQHIERPGGERLEVRVLIRDREGWNGYAYRWNAAGTDAELLEGRVEDGGWTYPGAADCFACHTEAAGRVLGLRARQLGAEQVARFASLELFNGPVVPADAFVDPHDASAPLERRARAYLAVNCGTCHRAGGLTPDKMDLRYDTGLAAMAVRNAVPTQTVDVDGDVALLAPGDPERSLLWLRMGYTDERRMPPVSSGVPDAAGRDLVAAWIRSLR